MFSEQVRPAATVMERTMSIIMPGPARAASDVFPPVPSGISPHF